MKYEALCLSVKNIEASKKFYQNLIGVEIDTDWGVNVSFKGGIALHQGFDKIIGVSKESIMTRSHNMELVFEADDFDAFITKVENYPNIEFVKGGVVEQPWGQRVLRHILRYFGELPRRKRRAGKRLFTENQIPVALIAYRSAPIDNTPNVEYLGVAHLS